MNRQRIVWCLLLVTLLQLWMVINGIQAAKGHQKQRVSRAITRRQLYRKMIMPAAPYDDMSMLGGAATGGAAEKARSRMLSPGYYSQECNAHKPCDKGRYCHMFLCVHCLKENVACTQNGQCCAGQCTYGRCKKDAQEGAPGTFCDRHDDCRDPAGTCCVREPAINPHISVCKPPLEENMVCGPINFFKNVYVGAQVQRSCGPCKEGLTCKQVGIFGVHEICVREDDKRK